MLKCPTHGVAPKFIFSQDLLELQADGTLPVVIIVEVKDTPEEEAFFRFNVSPKEAAKYPIVNNTIPFDENAADIMDGLQEMCGQCFSVRRKALAARSKK